MRKRLTIFLLCIVFAFSACVLAACSEKPDNVTEKGVPIFGVDGFTQSKSLKLAASDTSVESNSVTLTATITPEETTDKTVDWTVCFDGENDSQTTWATGKTVTDYVTVTPVSDGALTATVTCKAAFASSIKVAVVSRSNSNANASCHVYYRQKASSAQTLTFVNDDFITGKILSSGSIQTVKPIAVANWQVMAQKYTSLFTPSKNLDDICTIKVSSANVEVYVRPTDSFKGTLRAQGCLGPGVSDISGAWEKLADSQFNMGSIYQAICGEQFVPESGADMDTCLKNISSFNKASKLEVVNLNKKYHFEIKLTYTSDNNSLGEVIIKCKIDSSLCVIPANNASLSSSTVTF